jgi:arabinogalactan oligomer/maltooligosaccharide transport system permease protein
MKQLNTLEYLKLNKFQRLIYRLQEFFCSIPKRVLGFFKKLGTKIVDFFKFLINDIVDIGVTFKNGSWMTRVSFIIMGFGNLARKQILRGVLFFLFEAAFIVYMVLAGGNWLSQFGTLGTVNGGQIYNEVYDQYMQVEGDNSFKILLYGLISVIFIFALAYTWRLQIRQCKTCDEIEAQGKKVKSSKDDMQSLLDDQFHKTLLALPVGGICMFTVLPIIFMILVAFTNYDAKHPGSGYGNVFNWIGFDNFNQIVNFGTGGFGLAFGEILSWTLIWAIFATFSNYFLGMAVAIMINKKGIRIKKFWRTVLVMTIAIPQFVSLIYVSHMFDPSGLVNTLLQDWGLISTPIRFWENATTARIMVIVINIWIGIPYLMLMATGILMNIPQDLYESAKIDGANVWQQYTKITLPYMLFVTAPYLLTSFVNNLNNFNVIYLLTAGDPVNPELVVGGTAAGSTDLLITWLFKLTTGQNLDYKLASVVGILIFVIVAALSLIIYNVLPSTRNEEDYR